MARVRPSAGRARLQETAEALRLIVPARRRWIVTIPLALFSGLWILVLCVGAAGVIGAWIESGHPPDAPPLWVLIPFILLWVGLIATVVGAMLRAAVWGLTGSEVLTLSSGRLRHEERAALFGRVREFELAEIRRLRAAPPPSDPTSFWLSGGGMLGFGGRSTGRIAFDYGRAAHRFASGVDDAEAAHLVAVLTERRPELARPLGRA